MKLKKLLILAFAFLNLVPAIAVLMLLYKSGLELSTESYMRNLTESIHVQADFLSQTIENNMIFDSRFVRKNYGTAGNLSTEERQEELLSAFQFYLDSTEDRISVCILFDQENTPLYTIGESAVIDRIRTQLPDLSTVSEQTAMELDLGKNTYSLGIITPVTDTDNRYLGCMVSVYDKSYLFKIISGYHEISDTTTFICREDGSIVDMRGFSNQADNFAVAAGLESIYLKDSSFIELQISEGSASGYSRNIFNAPWYLVGLIDQSQIYAFANQFIWFYALLVVAIIIADIFLTYLFSERVVGPIYHLIQLMDGYPDSLKNIDLQHQKTHGYYETQYLQKKFVKLMDTIMLIQHNFEGVYQLYQSNDMGDINVDIDVVQQTIHSNKESFSQLIGELIVPPEACIVERFTRCFCDKDQTLLMDMFVGMRDQHLSVTRECEVFTPRLNEKWFHVLVVPMYADERLIRLFVQLRDITSFKRSEYESLEQSKREPLTGLLNRHGFYAQVETVLNQNSPHVQHGVLFLDINNFKLVNDNFGHAAGDELLCGIARSLQAITKNKGFVSRFGGDEFAVFLPNSSSQSMEEMKSQIEKALVFPYQIEHTSFVITASVGDSLWEPCSSTTLEDHLNKADTIMYQAKKRRKNSIEENVSPVSH